MSDQFIVLEENARFTLSKLETAPFGTNAYLLKCQKTGAYGLVDAPGEDSFVSQALGKTPLDYILITHSHFDHTSALEELKKRSGAKIAGHENLKAVNGPAPDLKLKGGEELSLGALKIKVLFTPGHTACGLSYYTKDILLSGDTVFPGGPGKTASNKELKTLLGSIRGKILTLPAKTTIYPGHGAPTTVKEQRPRLEHFLKNVYCDHAFGDVTWEVS